MFELIDRFGQHWNLINTRDELYSKGVLSHPRGGGIAVALFIELSHSA